VSRRYGRNQKRAHREEIARLKAEVQRLEADALVDRRSINRYSEALAAQRREMAGLVEEIRAVCRDSALLPAREVSLPGEGPWRLAMQEPIRIRFRPFSLDEPMMISTVDIYEVRAFLEKHLETFRTIVHVKLPRRDVCFAISRQAMDAFARHGLRQVAEDLFSMLWNTLREEALTADAGRHPLRPGGPGKA
jgi:hypothetical protein